MFSLGLTNRIGGHDIGSDGSAIAEAVARATDPLLIGADWSVKGRRHLRALPVLLYKA